MDLLKQKRELEEYRRHIQRVKNQRPLIDTTTPHSLGLKHLATRPKKQQLIEDRRQSVANENAKLMERMAKIMSSHTEDEQFVRMAGRNEAFRRREIDRINAENRAIVDRLQTVPPMLSSKQLEEEFQSHLKDVKKMMTRRLPTGRTTRGGEQTGAPAYPESLLYMPQADASAVASAARHAHGMEDMPGQPRTAINSISEFRKQVISTKKAASRDAMRTSPPGGAGGSDPRDPYSLFHAQR